MREEEIAAMLTRLREEVRGAPPEPPADGGPAKKGRSLAARGEAERLWPVSFDRPIERRAGLRGTLLRPVKALVRKLTLWELEPFALEQRSLNNAVLKLVDELFERLQAALDEGRLVELEERLTRLERRPPSASSAAPAPTPVPDYFAFEVRMRGSTADVRERQRAYVEDFREAAPVLDVGCGRGELLSLLREAGIEARGVDREPDMVAWCRAEGLEVEEGDALAYLEGLADGSLGGVFAAQVVEHMPPSVLVRFLELAAAKLRPGGVLVAETINPLSLLALRNYFADLTHAQPLVPETLVLLARQAGFASADVRFLNPPDEEERLEPVPEPPAVARNTEKLNEVLFGPQDYALVARR